MSLRGRLAVLPVLLLCAAAGRGDEPAPPLSSTQEELRELERQRRSAGKEAPAFKLQAPSIQAPGQPVLPRAPARPADQVERASQRSSNWLLNGVQQLEKEERRKAAAADGKGDRVPEEESIDDMDESDPNYLLKRYDMQRMEKSARVQEKGRGPADPMAPFLKNWLGSSPVRGQFFDQFYRGETKPESEILFPGRTTPGTSGPTGNLVRESAVSERSNPYLADQGAPATWAPPAGGPTPASPVPLAPTMNAPPQTTARVVAPAPPPREPPKSPILPPKRDAEKYFPQLKKF